MSFLFSLFISGSERDMWPLVASWQVGPPSRPQARVNTLRCDAQQLSPLIQEVEGHEQAAGMFQHNISWESR